MSTANLSATSSGTLWILPLLRGHSLDRHRFAYKHKSFGKVLHRATRIARMVAAKHSGPADGHEIASMPYRFLGFSDQKRTH